MKQANNKEKDKKMIKRDNLGRFVSAKKTTKKACAVKKAAVKAKKAPAKKAVSTTKKTAAKAKRAKKA